MLILFYLKNKVYKKNLAEEISNNTSHEFGKILRAVLSANRSDLPTDSFLAKKEAQILYDVRHNLL